MAVFSVNAASLMQGLNRGTHWANSVYLSMLYRNLHAPKLRKSPGWPTLSLLTGEAAEVDRGQKIYVVDGKAVHAFTVRFVLGGQGDRPVIFVETTSTSADIKWLIQGNRVCKIDVCAALGAGRFLYKEAGPERSTATEDAVDDEAGPSQRRNQSGKSLHSIVLLHDNIRLLTLLCLCREAGLLHRPR